MQDDFVSKKLRGKIDTKFDEKLMRRENKAKEVALFLDEKKRQVSLDQAKRFGVLPKEFKASYINEAYPSIAQEEICPYLVADKEIDKAIKNKQDSSETE